MKKGSWWKLPVVLILFFLLVPAISSPVWAKVLAEIKKPGIVITEEDLKRYISYYGPEAAEVLSSPAKKREFLLDLVKVLAVAAKAREEGFDNRPEIRDQIQFLIDKFLAKKYLAVKLEKAVADIRLSEEDLKVYYRTHPEEFMLPARVKFSALMLKGAERERLLEEAKRLRQEITKGRLSLPTDVDFLFVRDSGWKNWKQLDSAIRQALEKLPPKVWSEPIALDKKVYLLRKLDFKPARRKPFEEVKEEIRNRLLAEAKRQKLRRIIEEILKDQGARLYLKGKSAPNLK